MKNLPKDHLDIKNFDYHPGGEGFKKILTEYSAQFDSEDEAFNARKGHHS